MDKTTFLEELEKSLHVLKEEEIQDIIGEYEQHIDMKVKNGQTVEQAIADFGNVRELATEILEAYHVRTDEEISETWEEHEEASTELKKNQKKVRVKIEQFHTCVSNALARVKTWIWQAGKRKNDFFLSDELCDQCHCENKSEDNGTGGSGTLIRKNGVVTKMNTM